MGKFSYNDMTKLFSIREAYPVWVRLLFLFGGMALMLASCENVVVNGDVEEGEMQAVTVSVMKVENVPWQSTRAASDLCNRLSLAFFDYNTGEKVIQVDQSALDDDFGTFEVLLPRKSYHMVVVGYTADKAASLNTYDGVTFAENKITEVFSYYKSFKLEPNDETLPVTLKRVSAMVAVDITGDIPANVSRIGIKMSSPSRDFNPVSGLGKTSWSFSVGKNIEKGVKFYGTNVFAMENPQVLDTLIITAYNTSNNVIRRIEYVKEVSIAPNMKTVIKGDLFNTQGTYSVLIDDEWDKTSEYEIP